MSYIRSLPDALCEWFSDMRDFSDCVFCTQYPAESKITPLENPVIVLGSKSLKVLDNTVDETGNIITDSRIAELVFTVGIHVPRSSGGNRCNVLLDKITDMLLFNTPLSVSNVTAGEMEYIRNTDSLYLTVTFTVDETLKRQSVYPPKLVL